MNYTEKQSLPKPSKWRIVITILVLAILTFGGYHTGYEEGKQVNAGAYDKGYDAGYEDGEDEGYWKFCDEYEHLGDYEWMLENIVFTTRTGDCYHAVYCQYVRDREVWVHFVEGAASDGYRPCSVCIEH